MSLESLNRLPDEIDKLFNRKMVEGDPLNGVSSANLTLFLEGCKNAVIRQLAPTVVDEGKDNTFYLRFSNLGTPERKLWFQSRGDKYASGGKSQPRSFRDLYNFIIGDFVENLVLFLIRETGKFKLSDEQRTVELAGLTGHTDVTINDVPVDIKTASDYNFKDYIDPRFTSGMPELDKYGYITQLSGYVKALGKKEGAFLVINKKTGEIAIIPLHAMDIVDFEKKAAKVKDMLAKDKPPDKLCFEPEEDSKNGNRIVSKNCSAYCPFFFECYKDKGLRAFQYAEGIKYFTKIVKLPRVKEVPINTQGKKA